MKQKSVLKRQTGLEKTKKVRQTRQSRLEEAKLRSLF